MEKNTYLLTIVLFVVAVACSGCDHPSPSEDSDEDIFDDDIYPVDETREPCYVEETWQCVGDEMQLCRNGFWYPWYNCGWNGGTCWVSEDATWGECVDPEETQVVCPDDDEDCVMCDPDPPVSPDDLDDGVIGCCSTDGNAYWGVSAIVMQTCTDGCCVFFDGTDTIVRHACCE